MLPACPVNVPLIRVPVRLSGSLKKHLIFLSLIQSSGSKPMPRFKTFFAFFFLLIFTFNVIIYYSLFEFSDLQAKSEMGERLSTLHALEGTSCFKLPLSRVSEANRSEIWMDGKLFDIVRTEVRSDSVIVYVMNDSKEQNLVEKMKTHEEEACDMISLHAAKHSHKNLHKVPVQKYYPNAAIVTFRYHTTDRKISCEINCFYTCITSAVSAPPPERVVS
jgi:hypothetical protein